MIASIDEKLDDEKITDLNYLINLQSKVRERALTQYSSQTIANIGVCLQKTRNLFMSYQEDQNPFVKKQMIHFYTSLENYVKTGKLEHINDLLKKDLNYD